MIGITGDREAAHDDLRAAIELFRVSERPTKTMRLGSGLRSLGGD